MYEYNWFKLWGIYSGANVPLNVPLPVECHQWKVSHMLSLVGGLGNCLDSAAFYLAVILNILETIWEA